jgi:hypothetical protein
MYMFVLGVLFGSGLVLAIQELQLQWHMWLEDRVQAEADKRAQDLDSWGTVETGIGSTAAHSELQKPTSTPDDVW